MRLKSFKGQQEKVIKPPKVDADIDSLTEENIADVKRFLRYKLEYTEFSGITTDEQIFAKKHLNSELEQLKEKYEKRVADEAKFRDRRLILYAALLILMGAGIGWLISGDKEESSPRGINTIADCQAYLNAKKEITSYKSDYKTYYSDGTLGMPEAPLRLQFEGNSVIYNRCSPTSYSIEKHAGGDFKSKDAPYFTVTFSPDCVRGDDLILYVYLTEKADVSVISIDSKIFDSRAAFENGGNPAYRRVVSGPVLNWR